MIFQLLVFSFFITTAFSIPISPYLSCEEQRWQSIFVFLTTNYIAHAITTIPVPGAKWKHHLFFSFRALLLPNIGLIGAIRSVICHFVQGGSDDLHRALAQNALVILVKTKDIRLGDVKIASANSADFSRQVHGEIVIPPGYALIVPSHRQHRDELAPAFRKSKGIVLGASTEVPSAAIAIAQVIFSSITIYRARGDQINKYGYAAYGLSVYPYALMSLANLIKLALCGRYPFVYVLRTSTLFEAERRGGFFEGAVGNLEVIRGQGDEMVNGSQDDEHPLAFFSEPPFWVSPFPWFKPLGDYRNYQWIVPIAGSLILVIAIISQPVFVLLISGFNHGQSTGIQRTWMLGWLVANGVSVVIGLVVLGNTAFERFHALQTFRSQVIERSNSFRSTLERSPLQRFRSHWETLVVGMLMLPVYAFAIGGFVTVGGMLRAEKYQPC